MNWFSHVVVNVSDLERSRRYYEASTPLRVVDQFDVSDVRGSGIEAPGAYHGYALQDAAGGRRTQIHLVEWRQPTTSGHAYPHYYHAGFFRMAFGSKRVDEWYKAAIDAGGEPFTEPLQPLPNGRRGRPIFTVPDPDGIGVQWLTLDTEDRLYHVNLNTANLQETAAFLTEGIGLTPYLSLDSDGLERNSFGPGMPPGAFSGTMFKAAPGARGVEDIPFTLDVVEWTAPTTYGTAYPTLHHIGINRLALAVDDLPSCLARLEDTPGVSVSALDCTPGSGSRVPRRSHLVYFADGAVLELVDAVERD